MSKPNNIRMQGNMVLYDITVNTYQSSQQIPKIKPLNGFTATNIGGSNVFVNGMLLGPPVAPAVLGDSITIGGNVGEVFTGPIEISFALPVVTPNVEIVQKYYVTEDDFKQPPGR